MRHRRAKMKNSWLILISIFGLSAFLVRYFWYFIKMVDNIRNKVPDAHSKCRHAFPLISDTPSKSRLKKFLHVGIPEKFNIFDISSHFEKRAHLKLCEQRINYTSILYELKTKKTKNENQNFNRKNPLSVGIGRKNRGQQKNQGVKRKIKGGFRKNQGGN